MKVLIRKTAQGNEYWDAEAKKTLFVPVGEVPPFEVTENPKSMLLGVDFAKGPDQTVTTKINGEVINQTINFESMSVKQLKEYAADNNIEIPSGVTKKDDIISLLYDAE